MTALAEIGVDSSTGVPLLRTSERGDFRRCPWLWEQTWLLGRRSKREPTWAWFGTAIHRALEVRYPVGSKRGPMGDVHDAFDEALDDQERRVWTEGLAVDEEAIVDGRTLGHAMLDGYAEQFGEDKHWRVLHTEQPFQIEVPHPDDPSRPIVIYAGTWDLCVYDEEAHCFKIVDHKTRKQFPSNWAFYNINDQAGSYLWVAKEVLVHKGILSAGDVIDGLVFNALKKAMPDTRPLNADGLSTNKPKKEHYQAALERIGVYPGVKATMTAMAEQAEANGLTVLGDPSAIQATPRFHREEVFRSPHARVSQARRVQKEARVMEMMRKDRSLIFKHPVEDCTRCPIFEYCELHEDDPEAAEEFAEATMLQRDPYRDHRDEMEKGGVRL